jgi:sialate O-acetylesterase
MLRYAWADNSPANVYNSAGLPAVPFRYTLAD